MATGTAAILAGAPITATGGLLFADLGTALPADAITALVADYIRGGYVGEDGVTRTTDASDEKIRAWGGDTVKIVRTEHSITYTFQFLESANAEVLKLIHGEENVDVAGGKITIRQTARMPLRKVYVLDMKDGDASIREVVPDGQLTTSGDVVFVHSDAIRYEVTIEALATADGVKAITHLDDGTTAPVG